MKFKNTRIDTSGMFRCCIETLNNIDMEQEFEDGIILDCKYEKEGNQSMILEDGIWKWNQTNSEFRFS
jgi:hypothetical protein